jgi:hypothetical protein
VVRVIYAPAFRTPSREARILPSSCSPAAPRPVGRASGMFQPANPTIQEFRVALPTYHVTRCNLPSCTIRPPTRRQISSVTVRPLQTIVCSGNVSNCQWRNGRSVEHREACNTSTIRGRASTRSDSCDLRPA